VQGAAAVQVHRRHVLPDVQVDGQVRVTGLHVGPLALVALLEHVHHHVLELQGREVAVVDDAAADVGVDGEGLVQGQQVGPVDLLGLEVEVLGAVDVEAGQRRQHPAQQARAVDDAVQGLGVGLELQAARKGVHLLGAQARQLSGGQILEAAGHLGEVLLLGFVEEHGQPSARVIST